MFTSSTRDIPEPRAVPRHVAIIMDGNGRWAKQRMLPRVAGHRRGVEAVRAIILACIERDIEFLTLFAFSSENWRRPADEVSILMELFLRALEQEVAKLHANGIRFKVIGDTSLFDPRIRELIAAGEAQTAANTRLTLTVAANYGGRWDIAQAARRYFAAHPEALRERSDFARRRSSRISRWPTRPSRICSSAPAASSGSPISCCGSLRTPSSISPTCCGPTSTRSRSTRRSTGIGSASAASGAPANRCRRREALTRAAAMPRLAARRIPRCSRTRILTAVVLMPLVLAALFLLPPLWLGRRLARRRSCVAAAEWADLAGYRKPARLALRRRRRLLIGVVCCSRRARGFARGLADGTCRRRVRRRDAVLARSWRRPGSRTDGGRRRSSLIGDRRLDRADRRVGRRRRSCRRARRGSCSRRWRSSGSPTPRRTSPGRAFGRRKLAPEISPGKTWEGVYGGARGGRRLCARCSFRWQRPRVMRKRSRRSRSSSGSRSRSRWPRCRSIGDLFESLLKRQAGVKDSGRAAARTRRRARPHRRAAGRDAGGRAARRCVPAMTRAQRISVLGATGSIGDSALDVDRAATRSASRWRR